MQVSGNTTLSLSPSLVSIKDISTYHDTVSHCGASDTVLGIRRYTYLDTVNFTTNYAVLKPDTTIRFEFITDRMLSGNTIMCGTTDTFRTSYNYAELSLQQNVRGTYFRNEPWFLIPVDQVNFSQFLATSNNGLDSSSYSFGRVYSDTGFVLWNCSIPNNFALSNNVYLHNLVFSSYMNPAIGFPYNNPNGNPPIGIYLDPITSDLIYIPVRDGEESVFCIEVAIWQDDSLGKKQKVGVIRREQMRFTSQTNDNNKLPTINGPHTHTICEGSQLCFNITTNDLPYIPPPPAPITSLDTVTLTWDSAMAHLGATFTILDTTARLKTGRFCFLPTQGMASTTPYAFSVTASDDRGLYGGFVSRTYRVYVRSKANATSEIVPIHCSPLKAIVHTILPDSTTGYQFSYQKQLLDTSGNPIAAGSSMWFSSSQSSSSIAKVDTILGDTTGVFFIKNTINNFRINCPYVYYDTIYVSLNTYDFSVVEDTLVFCDRIGDSIRLQDSWEQVLWSTGDTLSAVYIDSAGEYSVSLTDSCGNRFTRHFHVAFEITPEVDFKDTLMCNGDSLLYVYPDTLFHTIVWSTGYTGDSFLTTRDGSYYVEIANNCGALRDSFILYENIPEAHIEQIYAACDTVMLRSVIDFGLDVETYWIMNRDTIADSVLLVGQDAFVFLYAKTRCIDQPQDYRIVRPLTTPDIKIASDFKYSCKPEATPLVARGRYVSSAVWSTGDTGSTSSVSSFGTYMVSSKNVCGLATDTARYVKNVKPEVLITRDSSVCGQFTLKPDLINGFGVNYFWFSSAGYQFEDSLVTKKLEYVELNASNDCGIEKSSVYMTPPVSPLVEIAEDSLLICDNREVTIQATGNFQNNWEWSTGDSTREVSITESGTYSVKNVRYCGSAEDSIYVEIDSLPLVVLRSDTSLCIGDSIILKAQENKQGAAYLWQDGSTNDTLVAVEGDTYVLQVTNACGSHSDSCVVSRSPYPEGFGTRVYYVSIPFRDQIGAGNATRYRWSTGETTKSITVSDTGVYWVELTTACESITDTIMYKYRDVMALAHLEINSVAMYPNPASNYLKVSVGAERLSKIVIINSLGAIVHNEECESKEKMIDLRQLGNGTYTVKLSVGTKVIEKLLIIAN